MLLEEAIKRLNGLRDQIRAGAPLDAKLFETTQPADDPGDRDIVISVDDKPKGLRLLAIDGYSRQAWLGDGPHTVGLLLRRLSAIRGSAAGGDSFYYACLGPPSGTLGRCAGPICEGNAFAASCADSFRIALCPPFWLADKNLRASVLVHEWTRNFAAIMTDSGREQNAACYALAVRQVLGVPLNVPRYASLCPRPPTTIWTQAPV